MAYSQFNDPSLAGNGKIEEMIRLFHQSQTPELFTAICLAIRKRMAQDGHFIFPADITDDEDGKWPIFDLVELE